jgi:hypothetical protein
MNPRPVIALPAAIQRRTNAARVDSGLSERRSSSSVMGILDLEKVNEKLTSPQLGCASESQRESNGELADWLALTKMMDGL